MRKQYHDPVTGDELSLGEHVSWMIQAVIRRWLFLGLITAITAYVWVVADPIWQHGATDQWNLWASYLAIAIESVTAMALINQTRRDAVLIRRMVRMEEKIEGQTEVLVQLAQGQAEIRRQTTGALQEEQPIVVSPSPSACTVCGERFLPGASGWYEYGQYEGDELYKWAFCCEDHVNHWLGRKG